MARFVKFPGTVPYESGFFTLDGASYLSTEDINLLDADTAHIFQSIGLWSTNQDADNLQSVVDATSKFGGRALSWDAAVAGSTTQVTSAGSGGLSPVPVADGAVSIGVWVKASVDNVRLSLQLANGGNTSADIVVTPGVWSLISVSGTATGGNDDASMVVRVGFSDPSGVALGAVQFLSAAVIRAGSDPTFVPSLRIVGNVSMETKASVLNWSSSVQNFINRFGDVRGYRIVTDLLGRIVVRLGDGITNRETIASGFVLVNGSATTIRCDAYVLTGAVDWFQNDVQIDTSSITAGAIVPYPDAGLTIGAARDLTQELTGDVSFASVKDGIGGPKVADLTTVGAPAGVIPDGTAWVGPDGRTWTAHGNVVATLTVYGDTITGDVSGLDTTGLVVLDPPDMVSMFDNDVWVIGSGWLGDGFTATLHDGASAADPILAQFDAEDIGL